MEIDVFTFVAQLFNFGLLVFLLRRFLYKPVIEAMSKREQIVAGRLQTAADEREAAEKLAREVEERLQELDETREELIAEARKSSEELALQLGESLKARMAEREREWRAEQDRRASLEMEDFRTALSGEIVETLRLVLAGLADESLEDRMTQAFVARLAKLDDAEIEQLLGDEEHPRLTVITSFPLEEPEQTSLEGRLRARFGEDARFTFEVDASRVAGVEVRCHGHRIGWSVGDYLEALDGAVQQQLTHLTQDRSDGTLATP